MAESSENKTYRELILSHSHYITKNLDVDGAFLSYLSSKEALGSQQIEKINVSLPVQSQGWF